jgi:hypothetical protein
MPGRANIAFSLASSGQVLDTLNTTRQSGFGAVPATCSRSSTRLIDTAIVYLINPDGDPWECARRVVCTPFVGHGIGMARDNDAGLSLRCGSADGRLADKTRLLPAFVVATFIFLGLSTPYGDLVRNALRGYSRLQRAHQRRRT